MTYTISREIGIDAGHRVPTHGSKCKNLHGHRYTIQAICEAGKLQDAGEQQDMALDFGFLKEEMMNEIDKPCDHGLILYWRDPLLEVLIHDEEGFMRAIEIVQSKGHCHVNSDLLIGGVEKIYVISGIPTAEVLAEHWFRRLEPRVSERSGGHARLKAIKVWETPNCWAVYSPDHKTPTAFGR